jgi:DNA-binding CsgD family transcriptional regulator
MRLLGRQTECQVLDRLVSDAAAGHSGVLVLRGEPGIGKSALLAYVAGQAQGARVVRAVGIESEMELAYNGLHQLCAPVLNHLERLPPPQRTALATVFGLSDGSAPDRFLVGLATLTLFAEVAEEEPLVCIVEDGHWLDQVSAQILAFVARRLLAERVVIVCAVRNGIGDAVLAGLPDLSIAGLGDNDALALLLDNLHGPLDAAVSQQIVAESHGNPLALLEFPRTWSVTELAGGFGLPERVPVTGRIEDSYAQRLRRLPPETQLLVLAAAADPVGDPVLLHRAISSLEIDMTAAESAVDAGLLTIRGRAEFAHPLVRSSAYRSAATHDRHRVHQALADATDAATDPDRRAWHRACAAAGPDEEVAVELERSAGRAQARGGVAAAAAFLRRAAELSGDPRRRSERALSAAQANLQAGAFDVALGLLARAEAGPLDEFQRACIDLARAQLAFASNRGNEATPLLLAAARRLEPLDSRLARETYLDAFSAAFFGARLNEGVGVPEVADAARALPRQPIQDATPPELLLHALVSLSDDYDTAIPRCQEALRKLRSEGISREERLRWLWQGCVVALEAWDDESASSLSSDSVQLARETGTLAELALALSARAPVLVICGELSAAASAVTETQSVEEATGIMSAPYGALILAAWRGNEAEARDLIDTTTRDAGARGEGIGLAVSEYARAVLCNGLGQYEEAVVAASSASRYQEAVVENWGLSELIEPAVRTGRTDLAARAFARLSAKASAAGTAWALGIEARSRALSSDGRIAEGLFQEAMGQLNRTQVRTELARTQLLYGEWLRREGRRVDARAQLRSAYELFVAMGTGAFAERARAELMATGERVRKRSPETRDQLTPQEEQIARLAREGLSNPEIGAQLYISAKTVEWHLGKVFTKLGIRSRRQLRSAPLTESLPAFDSRN